MILLEAASPVTRRCRDGARAFDEQGAQQQGFDMMRGRGGEQRCKGELNRYTRRVGMGVRDWGFGRYQTIPPALICRQFIGHGLPIPVPFSARTNGVSPDAKMAEVELKRAKRNAEATRRHSRPRLAWRPSVG